MLAELVIGFNYCILNRLYDKYDVIAAVVYYIPQPILVSVPLARYRGDSKL